jgi:hypothetical protein
MPLLILAAAVVAWLVLRKGPSQAISTGSQSDAGSAPVPLPVPISSPSADYVPDTGMDFGAGSGLDEIDSIVQAVIKRESGGRQADANGNTLKSSAGALGLMQLMPATAAQLGVNPNDATQNVQGGTAYLTQLFQKYGNWFDALAAYNWGPGNVDRAMASGGNYPASVNTYASGVLTDASGA